MSTHDPDQPHLLEGFSAVTHVEESEALNPVAVQKPSSSRRPSKTSTLNSFAWTEKVLPNLPPYLKWPTYERILREIEGRRLEGYTLKTESIKIKVPVRGNGERERTFRQVIFLNTPELQEKLKQLYETVKREEIVATGGQFLSVKETSKLDAATLQALMAGRSVRESRSKTSSQPRRRMPPRPVIDSK